MEHKSLIVYYSWIGSTEVVANIISEYTNIPTRKILEVKDRPKGKMMGAALGAFMGVKSKLQPMDYEMDGIKRLFLGTQVWAGKTTPAMNSFLRHASFKDKDVWLFMTIGDDKPPIPVIESIKQRIMKKGGTLKGFVHFQTHWNPEINLPIEKESIQKDVIQWIRDVDASSFNLD